MAGDTPIRSETVLTPLKVARGAFDALSKKDLDALSEFQSEETVDDFVAIGEVSGRAAIRRFFEELLAAFPDLVITAGRIVAGDQAAVVQWSAVGASRAGRSGASSPPGGRCRSAGWM